LEEGQKDLTSGRVSSRSAISGELDGSRLIGDFHPHCARKFFGTKDVPLLEYRHEDLDRLAEQIIRTQTSLTGVQPKLSLNLTKHEGSSRLTIVGLWGDYIFKPQTEHYPQLPENEDLTMHLAQAAKIRVVPHSLIRLADGRLGYITKRIDRTKTGEKIDMEDMCQLTLHPTEYKYKGSYEQVAKTIVQYSSVPKLDLTNYMQLLLFCFVTGNNDMHLKNFSLYRPSEDYQLTPAYDLLNVAIVNPKDEEELALSLTGRKTKLRLEDFLNAAKTMGLEESVVLRLIAGLQKALPRWRMLIRQSFLGEEMKNRYEQLITSRLSRL
jgi:serine/threonine-protein kinase HipA